MEIMLGLSDGCVRFRREDWIDRFYNPTNSSKKRLEIVLADEINADRAAISFRLPLIFIEPTV